jgi:hypothetical protein
MFWAIISLQLIFNFAVLLWVFAKKWRFPSAHHKAIFFFGGLLESEEAELLGGGQFIWERGGSLTWLVVYLTHDHPRGQT